jgi:hypothetical protein
VDLLNQLLDTVIDLFIKPNVVLGGQVRDIGIAIGQQRNVIDCVIIISSILKLDSDISFIILLAVL